jgi:predicted DNA-binding protein (MmcQ/YjbR family)
MNTEQLREFCLSLPSVEEDVKWGNDLCFLIGKKMFCVTGVEGAFGVSFKVTPEQFEELTETDDIIPAAYVARYKWISVKNGNRFRKEEWEDLIKQSYELVKSKLPKKLQSELS